MECALIQILLSWVKKVLNLKFFIINLHFLYKISDNTLLLLSALFHTAELKIPDLFLRWQLYHVKVIAIVV